MSRNARERTFTLVTQVVSESQKQHIELTDSPSLSTGENTTEKTGSSRVDLLRSDKRTRTRLVVNHLSSPTQPDLCSFDQSQSLCSIDNTENLLDRNSGKGKGREPERTKSRSRWRTGSSSSGRPGPAQSPARVAPATPMPPMRRSCAPPAKHV